MASITAVELNYIIFRYLQESGFLHTAFNFGYEAGVNRSPIDGNLVPPAVLFKLVQLGLHYKEMEANAENDADEDFCILQPMDLITKEVKELQQIVKGKKENKNVAGVKDSDKEKEGTSIRVVEDKAGKDSGKQEGNGGVKKNTRRRRLVKKYG